ncbi:serine/threonine protein kinase [Algicella marina]|uniref:Protein kinase n=1 Tax=Algicella marina TaxID=2683284 RepID=A0A6P1T1C1_9RHOB|nr:serine/threonine protein kinase [Algicella marina]QHQ36538.1 protein kinase [Algicella marina]
MLESRPSDTFQPDMVLNNTYRIEGIIGRGGTSEVYRARSEISQRVVAIKVLRSEFSGNEDYLLLMKREEEIREIRHDAIVRYSENHLTPEGHVYLVMDYVDGPGLDEKLHSGGLPADDLMTIAARLADGLYVAHARNIVHRDLSPDNIILRNGNPTEAVIIDFGIAKDSNPGAGTIVGNEFAGKYSYAAPEQLNGTSDSRSDIYSLGALLLASFRGETPNVGRNPMEVIAKKNEPLDTSGVPEPLKSLIDRMTQPNPDERYQSVLEILDEIDPAFQQTVIGARPISVVPRPEQSTVGMTGIPREPQSANPARKKVPVVILLIPLAIVAVAAGTYFSGILDRDQLTTSEMQPVAEKPIAQSIPPADTETVAVLPAEQVPVVEPEPEPTRTAAPEPESAQGIPRADPYTLIGERKSGQTLRLVGYAPDVETRDALVSLIEAEGGVAAVEIASGDISDNWGDTMVALITELRDLPEWRFLASGNFARVTGETSDPALAERIEVAFSPVSMDEGLRGVATIDIVGNVIPRASVQAVIDRFADCGPLFLPQSPNAGYGEGAEVLVAGTMATAARRDELSATLQSLVGARPIRMRTQILGEDLCRIDQMLRNVPSAGIQIIYGYGAKDDLNASNVYRVGENPVIAINLPEQILDGYVWASFVDVTGTAYHLLPHANRADNSVQSLRDGERGSVEIRLTWPVEDALSPDKMAFVVDDTALGTGKLVVLLSSEPLLQTNRPASEPVSDFVSALQEAGVASGIISFDSRLLITRR